MSRFIVGGATRTRTVTIHARHPGENFHRIYIQQQGQEVMWTEHDFPMALYTIGLLLAPAKADVAADRKAIEAALARDLAAERSHVYKPYFRWADMLSGMSVDTTETVTYNTPTELIAIRRAVHDAAYRYRKNNPRFDLRFRVRAEAGIVYITRMA